MPSCQSWNHLHKNNTEQTQHVLLTYLLYVYVKIIIKDKENMNLRGTKCGQMRARKEKREGRNEVIMF